MNEFDYLYEKHLQTDAEEPNPKNIKEIIESIYSGNDYFIISTDSKGKIHRDYWNAVNAKKAVEELLAYYKEEGIEVEINQVLVNCTEEW